MEHSWSEFGLRVVLAATALVIIMQCASGQQAGKEENCPAPSPCTCQTSTNHGFPLYDLPAIYCDNLNLSEVPDFQADADFVTLVLSGNELTTIAQNSFARLKSLKNLYLSQNSELSNIEAGAFNGEMEISNLWMSYCQLPDLDVQKFSNLRKLQTLVVSGNPLMNNLTREGMSNFGELKKFTASNIQLTELSGDLFAGNTELQLLDLSKNDLTWFPGGILTSTAGTLRELNLENNKLSDFPSDQLNNRHLALRLLNNRFTCDEIERIKKKLEDGKLSYSCTGGAARLFVDKQNFILVGLVNFLAASWFVRSTCIG